MAVAVVFAWSVRVCCFAWSCLGLSRLLGCRWQTEKVRVLKGDDVARLDLGLVAAFQSLEDARAEFLHGGTQRLLVAAFVLPQPANERGLGDFVAAC